MVQSFEGPAIIPTEERVRNVQESSPKMDRRRGNSRDRRARDTRSRTKEEREAGLGSDLQTDQMRPQVGREIPQTSAEEDEGRLDIFA